MKDKLIPIGLVIIILLLVIVLLKGCQQETRFDEATDVFISKALN